MPLHRQVFFLGGFDPKSARHYHRLFREAVAQRPADANPGQVRVGRRQTVSSHVDAWEVDWLVPGGPTLQTRYSVMRWDDIVRKHWPRRLQQTLLDFWRIYVRAALDGIFCKLWDGSRAGFWMGLLPMGVSAAVLAACAALAMAAGARGWLPWAWAAAAVVPAWLVLWRAAESRLDTEWLLRLYGFTWQQAHGELPDLEQRLDALADELIRAVRGSSAAEVLLIGHSTGSMMAIAVLARAGRKAPWLGRQGPAVSLLTLGQCTPVLAWMGGTGRFRQEVREVADRAGLTWIDYSARMDWAAFSRVPPWLEPGRARLLQASPRFHHCLGDDAYQALLKDRHALHMQYLRAPRVGGGYDPVELTCGPLTLGQRFDALVQPARTPR